MFGVCVNIAIALATLNAAVIAPMIHRMFRLRGYLFAFVFYIAATAILELVPFYWIIDWELAKMPRWLIPIFAFNVLLLPPTVAGLITYSVQRLRIERAI